MAKYKKDDIMQHLSQMSLTDDRCDALKIFERYGIKAHSQAISMLGYRVKWSGLDPDNAEILKM